MRIRTITLCLVGIALAGVMVDLWPCAAATPASKPSGIGPASRPTATRDAGPTSNPTSKPSSNPASNPTSKPSSNPASAPAENANWKVLKTEDFVIAVPRGWPQQTGVALPFFVGDGKVAPAKDEFGEPIQVGIRVERYEFTKDPPGVTAQKDMKKTSKDLQAVSTYKGDPARPKVTDAHFDTVRLSDGTEAAFVRTRMIKKGPRQGLELKIFAKEKVPVTKDKGPTARDKGPTAKATTAKPQDLRGVIVTAWISTSIRSQFITKSKDLERLLKAHLTTLCFNPEKFDTTALDKAYESKPTSQPTSATVTKLKKP